MRLVDTRAYVGMLKELVEQGKEVRMVISGSSMAPFLIHGRTAFFFVPRSGSCEREISYFMSGRADSLWCTGSVVFMEKATT